MFRSGFLALSRVGTAPLARSYSTGGAALKIGFIGLGNMGGYMSKNLLKNGHQVTVLDMSEAAMKELEAAGASRAKTPAEAADGADVVVTMLPSTGPVVSVYTGQDSVLSVAKKGAVLIDSSTIDPKAAKELGETAAASGCLMVDAPVSGGVLGAENATLTFMVGGSEDALASARPALECMGKNIVHCGENGTGQVAKLCNNLVLGVSMIGVAEAMNLGVQHGMDPARLAGIFNTSTARCWSSDTYNPCPGVMEGVPASREYAGGFGCDLMRKDLGLAVDAANTSRSSVPLAAQAFQVYSMMSKQGLGGRDFGGVYKYLSDPNWKPTK